MFWHLVLTLIVLIILVIIWWAIKIKNQNTTSPKITFPPTKYMEQIGGKCPDYWTYMGDQEGYSYCKNTYKIDTQLNYNSSVTTKMVSCYSKDIKSFPSYKHWSPTKAALTERCDWIKGCGPKTGVHASWIGMEKICSDQASK